MRKLGTLDGISAMAYKVRIHPPWRDPLFWRRALFVLASASMSTGLLLWLHQGVLAWLAWFSCVWPYRHEVRVFEGQLEVRWIGFRTVFPSKMLIGAELSSTRGGAACLSLHRQNAPVIHLRGSDSQLRELRARLVCPPIQES